MNWSDIEWRTSSGFERENWEQEIERIHQDPVDEIFVALENNAPVGMIWLLEHEGVQSHAHLTPWVSSLIVDPAHREKGIAAALLAHAEEYAAAGGDEKVFLLTESPTYYFSQDWDVYDTAAVGQRNVFVMQKHIEYSSKQDEQPDNQRDNGA